MLFGKLTGLRPGDFPLLGGRTNFGAVTGRGILLETPTYKTPQMSFAYSLMVRSEEKRPMFAVLMMDFLTHSLRF